MRNFLILLIAALFVVGLTATTFTDTGAGISPAYNSASAWGDYDNDGDLDFCLTGLDGAGARIFKLYRNDNGMFTDVITGITPVTNGSVAWGDYDGDGDLDLLITGLSSSGLISKVFRNNNGSFVELAAGLTGVYTSSATWGDYDNDGDLDILLAGASNTATPYTPISKIYKNSNGVFSDAVTLTGVRQCSAAWGDYDNDGDLDIALTGATTDASPFGIVFKLYRNDSGTMTDTSSTITGVYLSCMSWADYDNDGDIDLLLSGHTGIAPISKIYRNDSGIFAESDISLLAMSRSCASWGDYDNDGDQDIPLSGYYGGSTKTILYQNTNGHFTEVSPGLANVYQGSAAFGDYDNDGDLDILLFGAGTSDYTVKIGKIYRNDNTPANSPPPSPTNLRRYISGSYTVLQWDAPEDDITNSQSLTYSLRIGTSLGGNNLLPSLADESGYRLTASTGYANCNNTWKIKNTALSSANNYYWSVQAADGALLGSGFAEESIIPNIQILSPNGGELWRVNDIKTVYWDRNPNVSTVNIYLSANNGVTWTLLNPSPVSAVTGSYSFTVPSVSSAECLIKIESPANPTGIVDVSDSVFSIVSNEPPSFTLTSPDAQNLILLSGTTVNITWTHSLVDNINIEVTNDFGQTWNTIASAIPAVAGVFPWVLPENLSEGSYLRISSSSNSSVYDWSNYPFKIIRLRLLSPNGGQLFKRGQIQPITWTSSTNAAERLSYSSNNGDSWTSIASILGSAQTYAWAIPTSATPSDQYRIKIHLNSDESVFDKTDNPFTVSSLDVTYPSTTGIRLQSGKPCNITWTQQYLTSGLLLEYSTNGTDYTTISSNVSPSAGTYAWAVPSISTSTCKIRISLMSDPTINDLSNSDFSICSLQLTSPNGSEVITTGASHTIRWTYANIANVKLQYSKDGGATWINIVTSLAATPSSYAWTAPTITSYECRVRVLDVAASTVYDDSDNLFTIRPPIIVTAPNGGETITVGDIYNIQWTVTSAVSFILIDYSINNGSTWLPLVTTAYNATIGSYAWTIPNAPSTNCKVRVKSSTAPTTVYDISDNMFIITPTIYPPTAQFSANITEGMEPLSVQFTDLSTAGSGTVTTRLWSFGDGLTSDLQNPLHIYQTAGVYSVSLKVTNSYDSTRTELKTNYITVSSNLPVIALLSSPTMDFGSVNIGEQSSWVELSYQNIGSIPLEISQITLSSDKSFSYQSRSGRSLLSPGQTEILLVQFHPSLLGAVTDTLTISNSSGNNPLLQVSLSGTGLALRVPLQYPTIQAAINASNPGNCILVDDGVYYENLQITGKEVTLASNYFADGDTLHIANTIIDGSQIRNPDMASVIAILPGTNPYQTPYIVGFTIRNGRGWLINETVGSSIVQKRVGGGIYIKQSNPIFTANIIVDNEADDEGGGSYAFLSGPNWGGVVTEDEINPGGNVFLRNMADIGKDMYINASHTRDEIQAENCQFEVFCSADTTLSTYWATTTNPVKYQGSSGTREAINADLYVSTNGNNISNTGLSPESPFKSVNYALSLAYGTEENPITIHVASGIYSADFTGESFPLQLVDWITLKGDGIENTVIDAGASALFPTRIITCDAVHGVSIQDITLLNGYVTNSKNLNGGGIAILNSDVDLSSVAINNSFSAGDGAGLYVFNSSVSGDMLSLEYNQATGSGGGVSSESSQISVSNSILSHNFSSKHGGGLYQNAGQLSLENNVIQNNNANSIQMRGGGISLISIVDPILLDNIIASNSGYNGGGISMQNCSAIAFKNNKITNNVATNWGGGIYHITSTGNLHNNLIANNTASQRGGALYSNSSINIINSTIANNRAFSQGGAIYAIGSNSAYTNTILWNNSAPIGNELYLYDNSTPSFQFCDVAGGSSAFGTSAGVVYSGVYADNINANPLFNSPTTSYGVSYDALLADWGLQLSSPCVNTGNPDTDISEYPFDINGSPRIISTVIDIGAYETDDQLVAQIDVNPSDLLDFGDIVHNSAPVASDVTITNTGSASLVISDLSFETVTDVYEFEFDDLNQEILPNTSSTITVHFTPSVVGIQDNALVIVSNSQATPVLNLNLHANVVGIEPLITALPDTEYDFGLLPVSSDTLFTEILITNNGYLPLQISDIAFQGIDSSFNWEFSLLEQDILPDSSVTIVVSFIPSVIGAQADTLIITNNSGNNPLLSIEFYATVLAYTSLINIDPEGDISFGDAIVGSSTINREITFTNTGYAPLLISSISIEQEGALFDFEFEQINQSIPVDSTATLLLSFNPSLIGIHSATLEILNNSENQPMININLTAEVLAGTAVIASEPLSQVSFGQCYINSAPISREIILSNTGNIPLTISDISFDLASELFDWECTNMAQPILPGNHLTVTVWFEPTQLGLIENTILITNNSTNQPVLSLALSANVIDYPVVQQGNVSIQVIGYNALLSWEPFTILYNAVPTPADVYLVLYSEKPDSPADDYYFHGATADTTYTHFNVARYRDRMFYRVVGICGIERELLQSLVLRSSASPMLWKDMRKSLLENR